MILMILAPLIGVMGAILLSFGVWMIYPPGGLISAGMLCLIWSWLVIHLTGDGRIKITSPVRIAFNEILKITRSGGFFII